MCRPGGRHVTRMCPDLKTSTRRGSLAPAAGFGTRKLPEAGANHRNATRLPGTGPPPLSTECTGRGSSATTPAHGEVADVARRGPGKAMCNHFPPFLSKKGRRSRLGFGPAVVRVPSVRLLFSFFPCRGSIWSLEAAATHDGTSTTAADQSGSC